MNPDSGKTIFSFIVANLESAMKSSPTVTPTKELEQRENELGKITTEVWSTIYEPHSSSPENEPLGEDTE